MLRYIFTSFLHLYFYFYFYFYFQKSTTYRESIMRFLHILYISPGTDQIIRRGDKLEEAYMLFLAFLLSFLYLAYLAISKLSHPASYLKIIYRRNHHHFTSRLQKNFFIRLQDLQYFLMLHDADQYFFNIGRITTFFHIKQLPSFSNLSGN